MIVQNSFYAHNREEWRNWLANNFDKVKEIWLIFYKKHTLIQCVSYNEAVEEALCYGWIDSTIKRIDDEKYMQKFTPRKRNSKWSKLNIQRVQKMIESGLMTQTGLEKYNLILTNPGYIVQERIHGTEVIVPSDLQNSLEKDTKSLENFNNFSNAYRNLCIDWINNAKKDESRLKRVNEVVTLSANGKKIGMK